MSLVKRIIPLLLAAVLGFCFTACGGGKDHSAEEVVGTWVRTLSDGTDTITFHADMTYDKVLRITSQPPMETKTSDTFTFDGDTICINYSQYGTVSEYKVTFSGNKMLWDNGSATLEYVKQ